MRNQLVIRFLLAIILLGFANYSRNVYAFHGFERGRGGARPMSNFARGGAVHAPVRPGFVGPHYRGFVPARHWGPQFYHFYHTPWYHPVSFRFAWWYSPWYTPYAYYFHPYAVYVGPSFWLTDFVIADIIAAEYASQWNYSLSSPSPEQMSVAQANQAAMAGESSPALDEQSKEQIHKEVEDAVSAQQANQSLDVSQWLNDPNHVFLVTSDFNAGTSSPSGQATSCSLTHGDLLKVQQTPAPGAATVSMNVVTAKRESCPAGAVVQVSIEDLQKFQNDFAKTVDRGLYQMQQTPQLK